MLAGHDAVEVEDAEVGRPAADVADQDDVAWANRSAPYFFSCLRSPCIERRQGLFQQNHLAETGGFRSLCGQISRNVVEGGWNWLSMHSAGPNLCPGSS